MSAPEFSADDFATRLYEQLQPAADVDQTLHLWILCSAIGGMFQPVEDLSSDRDDGLSGYANLLDIDNCPAEDLGYLAQFVGSSLNTGLDDDQQREWVRSLPGPSRGRPETTFSLLRNYLVDGAAIRTVERNGSAWRYLISVRTAACLDPVACNEVVQSQKPGPDIAVFELSDLIDYAFLAGLGTGATVLSYGNLQSSAIYTSYGALANATLP